MSPIAKEERAPRIRAFNRFYTRVIGLLAEGHHEPGISLTEARVLFEIAHQPGCPVTELRRDLGLDAGYLSRILARFENEGHLERDRSPEDGRRQLVTLTAPGRELFARLDRASAQQIEALLAQTSEADQQRLVTAMHTIQEVLTGPPASPEPVLRTLRPGDLGWILDRHANFYTRAYGFDARFEAEVAATIVSYVQNSSERQQGWIAELAGRPVGSVWCVPEGETDETDENTARLRVLLVEPEARGAGVGGLLVEECLAFAREAGYRRMVLWTQDVLTDAHRLYRRAGFAPVREEAHCSWGVPLVGQTWAREL